MTQAYPVSMMWALKILRRIASVEFRVKASAAIISLNSCFRVLFSRAGDQTSFKRIYMRADDLEQNSGTGCCVHSKAAALRVILASPFPHRTDRPLYLQYWF